MEVELKKISYEELLNLYQAISEFVDYLETEEKTVYLGEATELNTRMIYLSGILSREKGVAGEIFLNMNLNTEDAFFREKI